MRSPLRGPGNCWKPPTAAAKPISVSSPKARSPSAASGTAADALIDLNARTRRGRAFSNRYVGRSATGPHSASFTRSKVSCSGCAIQTVSATRRTSWIVLRSSCGLDIVALRVNSAPVRSSRFRAGKMTAPLAPLSRMPTSSVPSSIHWATSWQTAHCHVGLPSSWRRSHDSPLNTQQGRDVPASFIGPQPSKQSADYVPDSMPGREFFRR